MLFIITNSHGLAAIKMPRTNMYKENKAAVNVFPLKGSQNFFLLNKINHVHGFH